MYHGSVSLLSNKVSEFHVLHAAKIPSSVSHFPVIEWISTSKCKPPSLTESRYVISANSHINEIALPTHEEFNQKSMQAMTAKDKFSLLKDVKPNSYYNILGEVIRVFDISSEAIAVYLSDYTENPEFFPYAWGETRKATNVRDGDEYGYTKSKSKTKAANEWPGPFGKMTIQLTLYDAHADFVREQVKVGQWILLSNIHIKYANMGQILEGKLHGLGGLRDQVLVEVLDIADESGKNYNLLKDAVRRKRDWKTKFGEQKKAILEEGAGLGNKRKGGNEEPLRNNSRKRRMEKRAAAGLKPEGLDTEVPNGPNLNENS